MSNRKELWVDHDEIILLSALFPQSSKVSASVTVEAGGSGSYLDCFSDASLEPPAIAVYNPDVLGMIVLFNLYIHLRR